MTTGLQEQAERRKFFGTTNAMPSLAEIRAYAIGQAIGRQDVSKGARVPTPEALRQLGNVVFDGPGAIGDALRQLGGQVVEKRAAEIAVESLNDCFSGLVARGLTLTS